jgi:CHAD domain-containing protein
MAKPTAVEGLSPDTPLRAAGLELVLARLADLRRFEKKITKFDPDDVHDMRVGARRLRAALQLFAKGKLGKLEPRVKALQDALGELRDVHVMRGWVAEQRVGAADRRLLAKFGAELRTQEREKREALGKALERWTHVDVLELVTALGHVRAGGRLGGKTMHKELDRGGRRVEKRIASAQKKPDPMTFHRLRIAAKKLRYLAELLEPVLPRPVASSVELLTELQGSLGDLHDVDVRIARLRRLGRAPLIERLVRERDRRVKQVLPRLGGLRLR